MRRTLLFAILMAMAGLGQVNAQKLELGAFLGISNYQGDLVESGINYKDPKPAYGGLIRYNLSRKLTIRTGFDYGEITADDAESNNYDRKMRNLRFESPIYNGSLGVEFFPWGFDGEKKHHRHGVNFSPYLFLGFNIFHFDPMATTPQKYRIQYGEFVELSKLHTEGQGLYGYAQPYKLTQISWPIGLGIKYAIDRNWSMSFEVRYNKTSTDYLDDVSGVYPNADAFSTMKDGDLARDMSWRMGEVKPGYNVAVAGAQRGNPKNKDSYIFTGFTISYTIRKYSCYKF